MPPRQRSPTGGQANFYISNCDDLRAFQPFRTTGARLRLQRRRRFHSVWKAQSRKTRAKQEGRYCAARIKAPTLNVSSATPRRRRWRKALRSTKPLLEIMRQPVCTRAHTFLWREEDHLAAPEFRGL